MTSPEFEQLDETVRYQGRMVRMSTLHFRSPDGEVFERDYITAQLGRFGGNISRTAQFIGMERSALHRKIKLLGLTERNMDDME